MSSLIFFIFMIWFIMRIVKNKQKAAGQNDSKQTQGSNTPGSAATRTGSTYSTAAGSAKKSAYESAMAFQKTATGGCPGSCAGKARGTGASPSGNRRTYGRRAVLWVGQHSEGKPGCQVQLLRCRESDFGAL